MAVLAHISVHCKNLKTGKSPVRNWKVEKTIIRKAVVQMGLATMVYTFVMENGTTTFYILVFGKTHHSRYSI
jgi:hypothetical protein